MSCFRSRASAAILASLLTAIGALPAPSADYADLLTPEIEDAIERGLSYLAAIQNPDGSWGTRYKVGVTALSLLAFMSVGYLPGEPPYGDMLDNAVRFLLRESELKDGYMGVNMYEHALATLALSEVWGMSGEEGIGEAVKRGVRVIIQAQSPMGGWRYTPTPLDADISVTVMQIVALASAKEAGVYVPDETIKRALDYVKSLQHPSGGFGYQNSANPGFARTAAGVVSLMLCGERDSEAVRRGLNYLLSTPSFVGTRFFYYGHYYAVQAVFQAGDKYFRDWYPRISEVLLAKQHADGSWPQTQDIGYSTAMAILILAVPYQFLPIYGR